MRRLGLLLVLCSSLAFPAAASAAPKIDRAVILSAASPDFAWDGEQAQAAAPQQSAQGFDPNMCSKNADYYCDITLVRLEALAGTTASVEFAIKSFNPAFADFDLSIFKSNAAGEPGEQVANGGSLSAAGQEETVPVKEMEPGYYLVTVSYYFSPNATFKGTIKASGITAEAAPPPAPARAEPAPVTEALPLRAATALGSARRATRKRSLAVKATATAAITNLSLALRDARGRIVATGRVAQFAAGSRALRLKVTRKLFRGTYSLVAIGIVDGAKRQTLQRVRLKA